MIMDLWLYFELDTISIVIYYRLRLYRAMQCNNAVGLKR